jgi:hypothetical protein
MRQESLELKYQADFQTPPRLPSPSRFMLLFWLLFIMRRYTLFSFI